MEFNIVGNSSNNNDINLIDVSGEIDSYIKHGETHELEVIYTYNGTGLTDITSYGQSDSIDIELFSSDNDVLYIGDVHNLSEISFSLETTSSVDLQTDYFYYSSAGTWKELNVTDSTNGFVSQGSISWATPSDINMTNEDMDSNAFANTSYMYYVAFQRRRNLVTTPPVENIISGVNGHLHFVLQEDMLKLNPVVSPPIPCDANYEGAIYSDSDLNLPCYCNGVNWLSMADFSSVCS